MCIAVLLGSNVEIPTSANTISGNAVTEIKAEDPARVAFSKKHVYYIPSHEGCSCGFEFDEKVSQWEWAEYSRDWEGYSLEMRREIGWTPDDELDEHNKRKTACEEFVALVRRLLENTDELELYAVLQDSEKSKPPTEVRAITPQDIVVDGRFSLLPDDVKMRILYKVANQSNI